MNVSPRYNRELEKLIVAMLAGLGKANQRFKVVVGDLCELLSINYSKAKDEQVLHLLDVGKELPIQ